MSDQSTSDEVTDAPNSLPLTHPSSHVSVHLQIEEPFLPSVSPDWLRSVAHTTLTLSAVEGPETKEPVLPVSGPVSAVEGPASVTLTLVVTDDENVRTLNRTYLDIDAPTDVLSFGGQSPDFVAPPDAEQYLGDVIISYPRAQAQAAAADHPVDAELALLVVHGVLHLLGYDHLRPMDKAVMWKRQADVLAQLGLAHIAP